jgi:hypothetical protein
LVLFQNRANSNSPGFTNSVYLQAADSLSIAPIAIVSAVVRLAANRWISEGAREIAYDQTGEANQEKLAKVVVFWPIRQQL